MPHSESPDDITVCRLVQSWITRAERLCIQPNETKQRGIKLKWVLSPKMAIMTAHSELLRHAVNMAQSISATLSTNLEFWVIIHKNCDNADIRNISVHGIAYAIAHNYKIMTVRQIRRFKF